MMLLRIYIYLIFLSNIAHATNYGDYNASAPKGGVFNYGLSGQPIGLNPILDGDLNSWIVQSWIFEPLCDSDPRTWNFYPKIAESWIISKDHLKIIFKIRPNIFFHNGQKLSAKDVEFSYRTFVDPVNAESFWRTFLDSISSVKALDDNTVEFNFKKNYFKNLSVACSISILPSSYYTDANQSKMWGKSPIGTGPYKIKIFNQAGTTIVEKFDQYYGNAVNEFKGLNNFSAIHFKAVADETVAIEMLKKGDLHFFEFGSVDVLSKLDAKPTNQNEYRLNYPKATLLAVKNQKPWSISYIGVNNEDPILKSLNVRKALSHLIDRNQINEKFFNGLRGISNGPIPNFLPEAATVQPVGYSPEEASRLLKSDGWKDADHDGVLEKKMNGRLLKMELNLIYSNKKHDRIFTFIQEAFKTYGIKLNLQIYEPSTFYKMRQENSVQLFQEGWGEQDIELDPKARWHSSSIGKNLLNLRRYRNKKVDRFIDEGRVELDSKKRQALFQKAYNLIASDSAALFLFYDDFSTYGRSNSIGYESDTLKHSIGVQSWWFNPKN